MAATFKEYEIEVVFANGVRMVEFVTSCVPSSAPAAAVEFARVALLVKGARLSPLASTKILSVVG